MVKYDKEDLYEAFDWWAYEEDKWRGSDEEFEAIKELFFNNTDKRFVIYEDYDVLFDLKKKAPIFYGEGELFNLYDYFDFLKQGVEDEYDFYDKDFVEYDDVEVMGEKYWNGEDVKGYFGVNDIDRFLEHLNKNRFDY